MTAPAIPYMRQEVPGTCALISLGNALLHLGIATVPWDQGGPEFAKLRADSGAERGSPTNIGEVEARWQDLRVDEYTALEFGKEVAAKVIDGGGVVSLPVWDVKSGLHSVLLVAHEGGSRFSAVNRWPFKNEPLLDVFVWEDLGFQRWNVPIRVYGKRPVNNNGGEMNNNLL